MTDIAAQTPTRHRRIVMLMIFVCVAITFLDRGNISLTAPLMGKELGIDPAHMGWILSGFGWTYALFQIPSGWLVDRIRPRYFYPAILILWSVATVFLGLVGSFIGLFCLRLSDRGAGGAVLPDQQPGGDQLVSRSRTGRRHRLLYLRAIHRPGLPAAAAAEAGSDAWLAGGVLHHRHRRPGLGPGVVALLSQSAQLPRQAKPKSN